MPELGEADWTELLRIYDSEVAYTDEQVGRLLDHLRHEGLLDHTLVVLTADHGEEFGDHGRWGHTVRLYEELVNVPLVIHYPGQPAAVESRPVALVDVLPTVLAVLGLPTPPEIRGTRLPS